MNLYHLDPYKKIDVDDINQDDIDNYHLTLPYYYVYQLIAIQHQQNPTKESSEFLNHFCIKKEENDDFRHGVIDAFCEIVRAGVKRLAFSHATDDLELFASDLIHAYACAKKYDIQFYIEENLIQTSLFHNSGSRVIIFYSKQEDIEDYFKLKEMMKNDKNPTHANMVVYGQELGRLLSYTKERIDVMINAYFNQ